MVTQEDFEKAQKVWLKGIEIAATMRSLLPALGTPGEAIVACLVTAALVELETRTTPKMPSEQRKHMHTMLDSIIDKLEREKTRS